MLYLDRLDLLPVETHLYTLAADLLVCLGYCTGKFEFLDSHGKRMIPKHQLQKYCSQRIHGIAVINCHALIRQNLCEFVACQVNTQYGHAERTSIYYLLKKSQTMLKLIYTCPKSFTYLILMISCSNILFIII